jgi:hypothetical protein
MPRYLTAMLIAAVGTAWPPWVAPPIRRPSARPHWRKTLSSCRRPAVFRHGRGRTHDQRRQSDRRHDHLCGRRVCEIAAAGGRRIRPEIVGGAAASDRSRETVHKKNVTRSFSCAAARLASSSPTAPSTPGFPAQVLRYHLRHPHHRRWYPRRPGQSRRYP